MRREKKWQPISSCYGFTVTVERQGKNKLFWSLINLINHPNHVSKQNAKCSLAPVAKYNSLTICLVLFIHPSNSQMPNSWPCLQRSRFFSDNSKMFIIIYDKIKNELQLHPHTYAKHSAKYSHSLPGFFFVIQSTLLLNHAWCCQHCFYLSLEDSVLLLP